MTNLKPIKLLPARERVASVLRQAILSRELEAGRELTLDSIAHQLQVSITPVREALQILSRDGFIKLRPNKGAIILGISEKTVRDHYEVRALLESEAARLVCVKGADLSAIIDTFEQSLELIKKNDTSEYSNYNQSFHVEIWTAADNVKLKNMLSSLWNGPSMGFNVSEEEYAKISINEHKLIVEALVARDERLAYERMNAHIRRSMENVLTHFL